MAFNWSEEPELEKTVSEEGIPSFLDKSPTPAIRDPFDPAPLQAVFAAYEVQIQEMEAQADQLNVIDEQTSALAVELGGQAKKLANSIEKKLNEKLKPAKSLIDEVNAIVKPLITRLQAAAKRYQTKITVFMIEEDRKRREAQAKAEAEARRLREEAEAKAKAEREAQAKALDVPVEQVPVVIPVVASVAYIPPVTKITTQSGSATVVERWDWEIGDWAALPVELFASLPTKPTGPDGKAISAWPHTIIRSMVKAAENMGQTPNIPGVVFNKVQDLKSRVGR